MRRAIAGIEIIFIIVVLGILLAIVIPKDYKETTKLCECSEKSIEDSNNWY